MIDTKKIKADFPIFKHNPELIYLDSGATTLKPMVVIDKLNEYYMEYSANVKRGIYGISERATEEYETARGQVAQFIGAERDWVIFTKGTTESLNLVAHALGRQIVSAGDDVVVSIAEHHSNFVPWQALASEKGANFKVIEVDKNGQLILGKNGEINLDGIITKKTKILALTLVSNVLGTVNPISEIAKAAKKINPRIVIVVDCAQAIGHMAIDVSQMGADFVAFSGHKMYGATGIGVLWGRRELLDSMAPYQYGGEMISSVAVDRTTFAPLPEKFEAGTPPIAEAIALAAAISYIKSIGMDKIATHEQTLAKYAHEKLIGHFGESIHIFGPEAGKYRAGILSFNLRDIHAHDIASILDEARHIAIRAGHHCAMPLHTFYRVVASARISFGIFNDAGDIDVLVKALESVVATLKR